VTADRVASPGATTEPRVRAIGRALFDRIGAGPRPWQGAWWDDWLTGQALGDPGTKIQLFRFVDALPALRDDAAIRRHLDEYLGEAGASIPGVIRLPLALRPPGRFGDALLARAARLGAGRMARRFIAGSTPDEVLRAVRRLRRGRLAFTADLLGEAVITDREATAYRDTCLSLLDGLAPALSAEPEIPLIDRDDGGPIPRANLSLKLSSLTARFDPIHAERTAGDVLEALRPVLRAAMRLGAHIHVDMEQYAYKGLTYEIVRRVLSEPEFRAWPDVGVVCQAYLVDALGDLEALRDAARGRGVPLTVRLVKGAYWDHEVVHARQLGWPVPVFIRKWETDANYERCARFLAENHRVLRPAFASHNARSLAAALAAAEAAGAPRGAVEAQVLYGMGEPLARALATDGVRVRVYTPFGALLPGMSYLVRRLLENTANESFLKVSRAGDVPVDELLRDPEEVGAMWKRTRRDRPAVAVEPGSLPPFRNEPPTDFSQPAARDAMRAALAEVVGRLGRLYGRPGEGPWTGPTLESRDPSQADRVVGLVPRATVADAERAIAEAAAAAPGWAAVPPRERAEVLIRVADRMRARRLELAAWQVYECGKPWREADADVAEAIDFCEFYAREMIRLAAPARRDVPGETNRLDFLPRGVTVIIPPWNFPLAIPCGMTAAALVAGNAAILKPAEQSPVIAWHLAEMFREAGLPRGVLQYLPGIGEEIGPTLVQSPSVALIAFTGSRPVGLLINRQAAETPPGQAHVKRVIAEMGGKNAIIVDDDADLDEAVVGVVQSAFGYAGQKCSACSRVIVLDAVHDVFLARLVEAARTLPVGPAEDPATFVGPVIDAEARDRVEGAIVRAASCGRVVLRVDPGELAARGHFVGPVIVADVDPKSRLAQEEIFGPVLVVLRARDLGEALALANDTEYALTGGLYSRSPAHIERVRREFLVGNLYINRSITGALVDRQPFGGFRLSGIGTKAGGPDYLREFLLPRTITENTVRRGFAPDEAGWEDADAPGIPGAPA
jgi:RHH-type proline utilization regulon transcriptional repressor/proline dehydrogenase/delta 1-pyrroline-5-carboxylate dehydrogenase